MTISARRRANKLTRETKSTAESAFFGRGSISLSPEVRSIIMFAIMTSFISDYFVVHIVSISFRIQVYIQIHAADWKNSGEGFGQYSGVAERRAGRIPSPDQLPSRSAERHGGGLESRSAFGLSSCPRKAFVAFELVAAAMHLLKVAQVSRASAETHWNDFVYFDAHWIRPSNRVVYRSVADGAGHLLREHSLSGEVAGPAVDAPWIPVVSAVGHTGLPMCVAGAAMPVSPAESLIMSEAWWASRHPWV